MLHPSITLPPPTLPTPIKTLKRARQSVSSWMPSSKTKNLKYDRIELLQRGSTEEEDSEPETCETSTKTTPPPPSPVETPDRSRTSTPSTCAVRIGELMAALSSLKLTSKSTPPVPVKKIVRVSGTSKRRGKVFYMATGTKTSNSHASSGATRLS